VDAGESEISGKLPLNPSGGPLGANPFTACGLIRVAETAMQLQGKAGEHQVKDPRIGFATLTGVTVTPDYSHATVRVSVLGSEDEKLGALEGLRSAGGFLRSVLAKALPLRTVPELHFVLDRGLEHAQRIDKLLGEKAGDEGAEE